MILPELTQLLSKMGVKAGDRLYVGSDLRNLGVPKELLSEVKKSGITALCASYVETLQEVLTPKGALFMPTYTYSACEQKIFDVQKTPSTVGVLTEYFRTSPNTIRSIHPIFSITGWGKDVDAWLSITNYDCFGPDSFFDRMCAKGGKYLYLGADLTHAATNVYYSMQKMRVPYRYFKNFSARIEHRGKITEVTVPYYVRYLDSPLEDDWGYLESQAIANGSLREGRFNRGRVLLADAKGLDDTACELLRKNPESLVRRRAL